MSAPYDVALQRIYAPHLQYNIDLVNNIKFVSSCCAGAVAGILGLENWLGFALFLISTLFSFACLYFINFKSQPKRYTQWSLLELLNPGQENVFSFILAWTLLYGACIHVLASGADH
jgi:ER membrane protein complex subunit 6